MFNKNRKNQGGFMISVNDLKRQILFDSVDEEHLLKIAKNLRLLSFKKGEFLFKEKDPTKGLYLIHSGKLEISKTTPDGWKQTLAVLDSGHFCGELSILEKRRHESNALALEDTTLFLLPKEDFEKMEKEDIMLAHVILKKLSIVLCKNLRRMNEKFMNVLINY
jgi:CRP-like cAMP-binding protein